ncbi:MAG: DNA polymerase/3'-5' exonuclease PolX [Candidatus Bathyarchaeia archaeon]
MSANSEVAEILYEIGEILTIKGDRYRSRAYNMAAQRVLGTPEDVAKVMEEGRLQEIPGIGGSISQVITEFLETGESSVLEELRESLPHGVRDMMELEGIGPKLAIRLNKELGITSIDLLEEATRKHRIRDLKGFGEKSEQNILESIRAYRSRKSRFLLGAVLPVIQDILAFMSEHPSVMRVEVAGSARRRKETVGDLDVLVASNEPEEVSNRFVGMPPVERVLQHGATKSTVVLERQLQVDLRVIPPEVYGAALQYFTGSKEHNVKLRTISVQRGYKLSEYGLFKRESNKLVAAETEEEIYRSLGMDWIPPELREAQGEIEAALEHRLPELVELDQIRGDLHAHTRWSEGNTSIRDMVEKARGMGMEYIAVTDHSKALGIANGLDEDRLREQMRAIDEINEGMEDFTVLRGIECDIMSDGSMDLADDVLEDLDWVIGSIHSGLRQDPDKMTDRILEAVYNPNVDAIGHPTGRLIQRRKPIQFDLERVFEAAAEQGVLMEINAYPERLDLSDVNCRNAMEHGVKICIGSDSHDASQMEFLPMGVSVARRGWLRPEDVVNTLKADEVIRLVN